MLDTGSARVDTQFAQAVHLLVYVAETDKVASSQAMAESINTNASRVRKLASLLKQAGLIESQQGRSGFVLAKSKGEISLADIYLAVYPSRQLLHTHAEPNLECPVGQHIRQMLEPTFADIQKQFLASLRQTTLADLISTAWNTRKN